MSGPRSFFFEGTEKDQGDEHRQQLPGRHDPREGQAAQDADGRIDASKGTGKP